MTEKVIKAEEVEKAIEELKEEEVEKAIEESIVGAFSQREAQDTLVSFIELSQTLLQPFLEMIPKVSSERTLFKLWDAGTSAVMDAASELAGEDLHRAMELLLDRIFEDKSAYLRWSCAVIRTLAHLEMEPLREKCREISKEWSQEDRERVYPRMLGCIDDIERKLPRKVVRLSMPVMIFKFFGVRKVTPSLLLALCTAVPDAVMAEWVRRNHQRSVKLSDYHTLFEAMGIADADRRKEDLNAMNKGYRKRVGKNFADCLSFEGEVSVRILSAATAWEQEIAGLGVLAGWIESELGGSG